MINRGLTMKEVFICDAVRTPIGRYGGALSSVRPDDLAALVLRALRERHPDVEWDQTGDVVLGCLNHAGEDSRNVPRQALLLAGFDTAVPGSTINRLCGSGMDAVIQAGRAIAGGSAEFCLAGGVESMSRAPYAMAKSARPFDRAPELHDTTIGWRFVNPLMLRDYGVDSMIETAENLARGHGISREAQDAYALESQRRVKQAQESGRLAREIVPVEIKQRKGKSAVIDTDEHPRDTELSTLASLAPVVGPDGSVTAGNSAGINDGAAALVLASRIALEGTSLAPRARIMGSAVAGVRPRIMGIGPVPAAEKLCRGLGMQLSDFDVIELNEAFAAQALAVTRQWGLEDGAPHVNPNGGAIALGHPLGMSGARLLQTAVEQLVSVDGERALCTMCIGVGQGIAVALERV